MKNYFTELLSVKDHELNGLRRDRCRQTVDPIMLRRITKRSASAVFEPIAERLCQICHRDPSRWQRVQFTSSYNPYEALWVLS